jgi:hypothetical protein
VSTTSACERLGERWLISRSKSDTGPIRDLSDLARDNGRDGSERLLHRILSFNLRANSENRWFGQESKFAAAAQLSGQIVSNPQR